MDHLERRRPLPGGLVAAVLMALTLAGCIDDDQGTASFGPATTAEPELPAVTRASDETTATELASDDTEPPGATAEGRPETTTTEPLAPLQTLRAELVVDGLDQPILVTGAPGTDALFVVEREGIILTVEDGAVADEPFLDLRAELLSSSIEQGLLGLAFHPDYATNGRFFAYWTAPNGDSTLAEFESSAPTVVDPSTMRVILQVPQPTERHNAGMVLFGPDGLLYLALGDGGSGGDTAQDTTNPLGSILRLDVSEPGSYTIPDGNPFGDEIWVYGLRNPWRFSIDPVAELAYIGDVGQEAFEEINVIPLDAAGTNFGWFMMEGDQCFQAGCDPAGFTPPALQYSHVEGCSVTGGWVYRGAAIPELVGHYFFADWCKEFVRSFRYDDGNVVDQFDWTDELPELGQVTSFGLDNDGELFAANWDGEIYQIVPVR